MNFGYTAWLGLMLAGIAFFLNLFSPTASAAAFTWSGATGYYEQVGNDSGQKGSLKILMMQNNYGIFELTRTDDHATDGTAQVFRKAGAFLTDDDGTGMATIFLDGRQTGLTLLCQGTNIVLTQSGALPVDVQGTYRLTSQEWEGSEEMATVLIESLSPSLTGLRAVNRPYRLEYDLENGQKGLYEIRAIYLPDHSQIARFLMDAGFHNLYRADVGGDIPLLIWHRPDHT